MTTLPRLGLRGLLALYSISALSASLQAAVAWKKITEQPAAWYATDEAATIADSILTYQYACGGWPKNTDMSAPLVTQPDDAKSKDAKTPATIDNGATTTQLNVLAKIISRKPEPRWLESFNKGFDYLLAAQLPNGGWAQYYPERKGYYTHITFNDNAMVNVLKVLRAAAQKDPDYAFLSEERRTKAATAFIKGIECILRCQVKIDGVKTVWCAQHDENTFAPAPARKFEPVSLSGAESAKILELLMDIPKPSPAIIESVNAAAAWFEKSKLTGLRLDKVQDPSLKKGYDLVVVEDKASTEVYWARFYEIPSNKPIFMGRDAIVHYKLSEIEYERRVGYSWYVTEARNILDKKYPKWKQRVAP